MNTAEKIAAIYLRLNGFLLLPHFTVFDGKQHNHIDIVGLRAANSVECLGDLIFPIDNRLFKAASEFVNNPESIFLGALAEVRTNQMKDSLSNEHVAYLSNFLGGIDSIRLSFYEFRDNEPTTLNGSIDIGNRFAMNWIIERINWMQEQKMNLTKHGSWFLSEEWLADILVLTRMGLLQKA